MKSFYCYSFFALLCFLFLSCNDDINDIGSSIQPEGDKIVVNAANFNLSTENLFVERIYNRPDSFLLGRFDDPKYGSLKAEILAQFNEPFGEGIPMSERFPQKEGLRVDSTKLVLYFSNWFGSDRSTLRVSTYRINKKDMDVSAYYPSDVDPLEFVDMNASGALLGEKVFTAVDYSGEGDSLYVSMVLDSSFSEELFDISKNYTNLNDFLTKFKGLYLTTDLGDATIMDVTTMRLILYHSFPEVIGGRDTIISNSITFAPSVEVNQVNIFNHTDRDEVKANLNQNTEFNYVSSPSNIYTKITVPVKEIIRNLQDSIGINKKLIVNNATILAEVVEEDENSDFQLAPPSHMILLKESEVDLFFTKKQLTNDSVIFSSLSNTNLSYTFDIGSYLTKQINKLSTDNEGKFIIDDVEDLNMVMIPVSIKTSSDYYGNSTLQDIKQEISLTGTTIRSGQNSERNMIIRVIFSGF